ncbi:HK97 family phage prohead protease [Maritimibacter sp. UBA3975]|uniref:HK97 family phage prohead protease n=1 Tax=Maritimibacter sp. UBA3975 TaxID=1946833 RepID=UPI000C096509|nr:HK97 family phage prohead protease [Maritimibacter sp. UBA3975]MAM61054.1 HK97 family phage prohead protease [Maritimibacter sp.]|tara:strand:- start:7490 stop:8077 length:588 start_codon:yes stop_codon:yes gene_type:complete
MSDYHTDFGLEHKFVALGDTREVDGGVAIEGYASFFGEADRGGDIVAKGAYAASLAELAGTGGQVKMLWQHDPAQPIGVWDEVREDARGLFVKGRILADVAKGREAARLIEAGAIDGLSIGYRTVRAARNEKGQRLLKELELWEVSLVTFPMLPSARVGAKGDAPEETGFRQLARIIDDARLMLTRPGSGGDLTL